MSTNSFSNQDYILAKEYIDERQCRTNETVDGIILRKRKAELNELVRKVIKNELTNEQKLLVKLHWYDGMSQSQISEKLGLDRSTLSRKMGRINEIIYDKLKYAIEFRYGSSFLNQAKLIITDAEALGICIVPNEISKRITKLRLSQCLTAEEVSRLCGIPENRLQKIEKDGSKISVLELKKLAVLFRVTSDYILFGTSGQLH